MAPRPEPAPSHTEREQDDARDEAGTVRVRPRVYKPTVVEVRALSDVVVAMPDQGRVSRDNVVGTGRASPRPDLDLFSPFGDQGASRSMAMVMVPREIDGFAVMTTPEYASMLVGVERPGRHLLRIDGTGRAPDRTVRVSLQAR